MIVGKGIGVQSVQRGTEGVVSVVFDWLVVSVRPILTHSGVDGECCRDLVTPGTVKTQAVVKVE